MSKGKSYSAAKGQYIQGRMNEGRSNDQARREWNRDHDFNHISGKSTETPYGENIDRSEDSPMQDYAGTSEDL